MEEKIYDVIVIGAGPGGASTAYFLAKAGHDVLLLDKSNFPRDKTCGDGLTPRALGVLTEMGLLKELERLGFHANSLEIAAPGGYAVKIKFPKIGRWPDFSLVVPRQLLDDLILKRATMAGAHFESPVLVKNIDTTTNRNWVTITGERAGFNSTFKGRVVVLAVGSRTKLLLEMGLLKQPPRMMLAARTYYEGLEGLGDTIQTRYQGVPLPGYGWVFPTSATTANIGVIYWPGGSGSNGKSNTSSSNSHTLFNGFVQTRPMQKLLSNAGCVSPVKSFPLRTDFATATIWGEKVLLVGDAAGLINPLTGEGTDFALESGKLAAYYLHKLLVAGKGFSYQNLAGYDRLLRRHFQDIFTVSSLFKRLSSNAMLFNQVVKMASFNTALQRQLISSMLGK